MTEVARDGHVVVVRSEIVWAALLVGCGGRVLSLDGGTVSSVDGSSAPGIGDDGAPGTDFGVCPPGPPTVGASCVEPAGFGCAYVEQNGAATESCQAFMCSTGHWQPASSGC